MFSPTLSAAWQYVAHEVVGPDSGFAIPQALGNSGFAPAVLHSCSGGGQDCYPFPFPWSGPRRVGPFFEKPKGMFGRSCAICVMCRFFWFVFSALAVESPTITTNNRGRKSSCGTPLSCWPSFPCRLLAVCKTLHRGALPGPRRVRHLPILRTTMRLLARLLAVWPGPQPAASTSVCRPAIDLKPAQPAALAACQAAKPIQRSSGKIPRLAAFEFSSPPWRLSYV